MGRWWGQWSDHSEQGLGQLQRRVRGEPQQRLEEGHQHGGQLGGRHHLQPPGQDRGEPPGRESEGGEEESVKLVENQH